jgi:hypothetical protein
MMTRADIETVDGESPNQRCDWVDDIICPECGGLTKGYGNPYRRKIDHSGDWYHKPRYANDYAVLCQNVDCELFESVLLIGDMETKDTFTKDDFVSIGGSEQRLSWLGRMGLSY